MQKKVYSWALYDWANSAFATTVMAGFFPIFFKSYWAGDLDPAQSTFAIGSINSFVGLIIAISAPILGALADVGRVKKRSLLFFALIGILSPGFFFFLLSYFPICICDRSFYIFNLLFCFEYTQLAS